MSKSLVVHQNDVRDGHKMFQGSQNQGSFQEAEQPWQIQAIRLSLVDLDLHYL